MRKLWVKAWLTLDGVFDVETMDHWWPPKGETAADYAKRTDYITEEYSKGDAYLLGRTTYEMLWPAWSTQTDTVGSILNSMQKYVVSTTLESAPWKESTIIRENVVEEIRKLKEQPGKDIIIDGSAALVHSLMGTDLIDEYHLLIVSYTMGRGRRFFPDGMPPTKLQLVESKRLSSETLALVYQSDKD
ncbi:dihydrofolate reductase [Ktedonosporobacter rubrisoli]|uniref:Dihydrofolate reductase n=1 Tax=Ktedonosporobacter rubrisoli TaxID=2509675 RepID=A0A4P6JU24_KTERU|nr:dihydrofolate reductase family protein [Ktedonosporobacter rubrisoli]QBD78954.1 dihydrofolate reductase [Ktedonosporobacter rubrisoli]